MKTNILFLFFNFLLIIFLSSCSDNSTNPNKNTEAISGKVTLVGQNDHSGVTVSLYQPITLDTALVRINQLYPNIGVQISQETEFDHREYNAVASTTTTSDGSWGFENVASGNYNLVVTKDGYGWQYRYTVNSGSFTFELSPTILQKEILTGNIVWESGKTYMLEGDVYLEAGAAITIQDNVWCLAKQNSRLIVDGKIIKNSPGFAHFTRDASNTGIWRGIEVRTSENTLKGIIIDKATIAISSKNSTMNHIENAIIRDASSIGISLSQNISQHTIKNVLLTGNTVGIEVADADSTNIISKTVIFGSDQEGILMNQSNIEVSNNIIRKNLLGIKCWFLSDAAISNNLIKDNLSVGIEVSGCKPIITYNNIVLNAAPAINITAQGYNTQSQPVIRHNNMSTMSPYIIQIYGTIASNNGLDIDATNNWWSTTDIAMINDIIFDKNDIDPSNTNNYPNTGYILYLPILSSEEPSAGISN